MSPSTISIRKQGRNHCTFNIRKQGRNHCTFNLPTKLIPPSCLTEKWYLHASLTLTGHALSGKLKKLVASPNVQIWLSAEVHRDQVRLGVSLCVSVPFLKQYLCKTFPLEKSHKRINTRGSPGFTGGQVSPHDKVPGKPLPTYASQ